MTPFYGRGSMLAASAVALLVMALGASLGLWQLRRAHEKEALQAEMDRAAAAPPIDLAAAMRDAPGGAAAAAAVALDGKRVAARGTFVEQRTVFLDNRTRDAVAGFHVLTPLQLAGTDRAVLVLRGWAPRHPADRTRLPPVPTPAEPVQVEGTVQARLAQPLRLGEEPAPGPGDRLWQHFEYDKFERWSGLAILPVIVRQTTEPAYRDGLARDWNQPGVTVDRHYGYAFQWFALTAVALVFWVVLLYRHVKGSDVHADHA